MGYIMLATLVGAFPFGSQLPRTEPKPVNPVIIDRLRTVLKPGQVCAIPLINVLPRKWNGDHARHRRGHQDSRLHGRHMCGRSGGVPLHRHE